MATGTVGEGGNWGIVEQYVQKQGKPRERTATAHSLLIPRGLARGIFIKVIKPDQLMEHSISSGEAIHKVGLAGELLADLGWDVSLEPMLTSPPLDSTLAGSAVTFEWQANNQLVTEWWLYVGFRVGARDLYDSSDLGTKASVHVLRLPTDGRILFVRLWYKIGGLWQFTDEQFTAATLLAPRVMSSIPGSTLNSTSATFQWINNQPRTKWWFYIGSKIVARDICNSGALGTDVSHRVTGLPTDGRTLYARLWYRSRGIWQFADLQYIALKNNT